jgi:hypothetical protein
VALLEDGQAERAKRRALRTRARLAGRRLLGRLGRRAAGCWFAGRGHGQPRPIFDGNRPRSCLPWSPMGHMADARRAPQT